MTDLVDLDLADVERHVDLTVVGAGFAGLYMVHRARGLGLSIAAFEAGGGVGGTWYWNRYPGARCDVESLEYSYGFSEELQQEWEWSERYAAQPEILRYAEHVADRFDLWRHVQLNTRVTAARFDDGRRRWLVETDAGDRVWSRFVVMATGCLSSANVPDLPGRDSFEGQLLHTGRWPHDGVDLTDRRVVLIGTGSSAVQAIPIVAAQAAELTVLQRTATYAVPARNGALAAADQAAVKAEYAAFRARNRTMSTAFGGDHPPNPASALSVEADARTAEYERRWQQGGFAFLGAYSDLIVDLAANDTAAEFVRAKIRSIVEDPDVARLLEPSQVLGCKRLCLDSGYYETFNRPNVHLVDVNAEPIQEITPTGVRVGDRSIECDVLVFATGFDAMTGALLGIDIRGRCGVPLQERWAAGPTTYLGLAVHGFPNLFTICGPGSPSVLTNMIVAIEQHVDWIADCLALLRAEDYELIEATAEAEEGWVAHVNDVADRTLFPTCSSWYLGANVPGKQRVFMPLVGFPQYVERCEDVVAKGYEGFALSR